MDFLAAARYMDEKPRATAGGRSFAFRHEIKLDRDAKHILFVEASYDAYRRDIDATLPFWEWRRHSFKDGDKFRTFMCARGNLGRDAECHACDLQYDKDDKRLALRVTRYWPVIHLDDYYVNQYGSYVQPKSRSEERDFEERGYEKVFGKLGYLELGKNHNGHLLDIIEQTSNMCVGCLSSHDKHGQIEIVAYTCPHCGNVHDHIEQTSKSRDQWRAFGHGERRCGSCGANDFPKSEIACSQCDSPERASMYDLVYPLVKNGSGKDTSINLAFGANVQFVDDYLLPNDELLMEGFNEDGSRNFSALGDLYRPVDFQEIFKEQLDPAYAKGVIGG